jgi:large subunit ribosomal protein L5
MQIHFDVARKKSLEAVDKAMENDQCLFLAAQKDSLIDDPSKSDIYRTGTIIKISQFLKLPNKTYRVLGKGLEKAVEEMEMISGQKPVITRARKSVANFKLREGMPIGAKVTLRADKMFYFMDKLVSVSLPRVRDFRGVNANAFDGRGNYALGVKEQLIFPEIEYDKVDKVRGMDIIFVTTAKTDEEARELLKLLGMPFSK